MAEHEAPREPADRDFLSGGGAMGALMRAFDWSSSPLGPPSTWSQSLRTVVRLMLNTGHPMYIWWGADGACLYNDAYSRSIGPERHPGSLGKPAREVWAEIWDLIGPQIAQVLSGGGATWHEDHLVPITRHGRREDVYWTYSYSPIDDPSARNGIGGVLVICTETTKKVLAERRLAGEIERLWRHSRDLQVVVGSDGIFRSVSPAWKEILGHEPDTVVGRSFLDFIWSEDAQRTQTALDTAALKADLTNFANRYHHQDGTLRWISWRTSVEDDFVYAYGRDITMEKEALSELALTKQLAQGEARYRSALKAGRLVHWETDLVAGTRTWTDEAMELFGLTLAGHRGRVGGDADEFKLALHPDDRHLPPSFYELAHRQDWYPVEYRILKPDGTIRWVSGGGQVVSRGKDGKAQRLVNVVTDITDRKLAEEHIKLLMNELSHRAKNLLAVVLSIATQTRRTAGTFDEFLRLFTQRLQGLAASHDLLALQDWQGASLTDLVRDQLAPFVEAGSARLSVSGSSIFLGPKAAEAIGLALHELATNAVKYGALSSPAGRVTVSWDWKTSGTEPRLLQMSWEERGGPLVSLPTSKGFGHVVFGRIVTEILAGKVEMDFAPEGLNWKLSIPTRNLVTEQAVARDWFASPARLSERRAASD
jgi:PAS domain S-box-containing protein